MTTQVEASEDILMSLDFAYVPACESIDHQEVHDDGDPAWALIRVTADCGYTITGLICKSGWDSLAHIEHGCCPSGVGCGAFHPGDQWHFDIIRLVQNSHNPS